jgi:hypothetical protein
VPDWDWSRVVFDHVKIGVSDADESKRFYTTVLAELDIPPLWEAEREPSTETSSSPTPPN